MFRIAITTKIVMKKLQFDFQSSCLSPAALRPHNLWQNEDASNSGMSKIYVRW